MQRKIGIIDVGSNTSRLNIMAYTPDVSYRLVDQLRERARLGEGMGAENLLRPEPMDRTVRLLKVFRGLCQASGTDAIVAVGTSAVRDARNQAELLRRVQAGTGITLRVLSGDEEAYYGYLGAVNSVAIRSGLMIDIGGGSLELVRVQDRTLRRTAMLPAGAVRLTEAFLRSDPPRAAEVRTLTRYLEYMLNDLDWIEAQPGQLLVGMGGTIRALAKIDQRLQEYPLDLVHEYALTRRGVEEIVAELIRLPLRKRRKLPGLTSDRADVLLGGALALLEVMRRTGYSELLVSAQGLREGLFYEHFLRDAGTPTVPDARAFAIANLSFLYEVNWPHARHVEALAISLFDQLRRLHGYGPAERVLLSHAALLHDVGLAIDYYTHHEHSANLILHAELPGFTHREMALISQLALYHRRGLPKPQVYPGLLRRQDTELIEKLGALLRLAEYLERSRTQVIQALRCRIQADRVTLECLVQGDASTELWATERKADLFRRAFRRDLALRTRLAPRPAGKRARPPSSASGTLAERMRELMALSR